MPARPTFTPDKFEVAQVLEVPLTLLMDPATVREESWQLRGVSVQVPFFLVEEHKVWGATAMVLAEFLALVRNKPF